MQTPTFTNARVLVAGDLMLDRYWDGSTVRISPEAPVPVVRVGTETERPGGAGNVALGIAALGGHATVVGLCGADAPGERLRGLLEEAGVAVRAVVLEGCATVTKLRVLSRHQQLIRLDFEDEEPALDTARVLEEFRAALADADLVVFSDYGKGVLRDAPALIAAARAAGRAVLVDPKGGDFERYRGARLVTPNRAEFEAVVGVCRGDAELEARARTLAGRHGLDALLLTLGEEGMMLVSAAGPALRLPAQAREVFDVTGAGDTVIGVLAAALAAGEDLAGATALANLAAGIVVGKLGAATVTAPELRRALRELENSHRGVVDEAALLEAVADARAHGESVVMTNGCFDLLHAGHVGYLEHARGFGERLVVAVNDDDSVRRLKGPDRPLVTGAQRMEVLAALRCVDWVVAFSEDTPERLIGCVVPDVLVKGGDYRRAQIAGARAVEAAGGRVVVLPYREGCSTSGLVDRIRSLPDPAAPAGAIRP